MTGVQTCALPIYAHQQKPVYLNYNYRNPTQIIQMVNHLSRVRTRVLRNANHARVTDEVAIKKEQGNVVRLIGSEKEKRTLLEEANRRAYAYIVVPTERERDALRAHMENDQQVFTISEIKGLENKNIILVNFLSHYREKWLKIKAAYEKHEQLAANFYHHLFNMLYVGITRSERHLCLMDEVVEPGLDDLLWGTEIPYYDTYDPTLFGLLELSNEQGFFEEAKKLYTAGKYEKAITLFRGIDHVECDAYIGKCNAYIGINQGDYRKAAACFVACKDYVEARRWYEELSDREGVYYCILAQDKEQFKREVLYNEKYTFERDVKPYLSERIMAQLEEVCVAYSGEQAQVLDKVVDEGLVRADMTLQRIQEVAKKLEGAWSSGANNGGSHRRYDGK